MHINLSVAYHQPVLVVD